MKLAMIGTSGGIGLDIVNVDRAGPSVLVEADGDLLMFDAGRSALQNVLKAGYNPSAIDHLFLTHLHSDHVVGVPDIILSPWITFGKDQWNIFGPKGTRRLIDGLFGPGGAFHDDIMTRSESPGSKKLIGSRTGKPVNRLRFEVKEISHPGTLCRGKDWEVVASFAPKHVQPWLTSIAFKINSPKGSVVITGDTGPHQDIIDFAKGCSVLVHDCTIKDRKGIYADQLVHTDPMSLGLLAAQAEAKTVIATHFARRVDEPETLASFHALVAENFSGRFIVGEDLLKVDVATGDVL
jgi:ribonuclease Z